MTRARDVRCRARRPGFTARVRFMRARWRSHIGVGDACVRHRSPDRASVVGWGVDARGACGRTVCLGFRSPRDPSAVARRRPPRARARAHTRARWPRSRTRPRVTSPRVRLRCPRPRRGDGTTVERRSRAMVKDARRHRVVIESAMGRRRTPSEGLTRARMRTNVGAKIFKTKCAQCHVAEKGGGHKQVRGRGRARRATDAGRSGRMGGDDGSDGR